MSIYAMGPRTVATAGEPVIALIYDDDAYVESAGLVGRRVAGRSFLEAYLAHGRFQELVTLIRRRSSTATMIETWRSRPVDGGPERSLRIIEQCSFHKTFLADPPATVIHAPQPPDWKLAWARQQAGTHAFSLTGVTHTLCSIDCVTMLREMVTSPYEPYDALICTSRAVVDMVRRVTGSYAEYLRSRFGGTAAPERSTIRLEMIPLGVDMERFRPARAEERALARNELGIADDEVVVLFVGRLAHHAKAHPFPLFRAASEAARLTGRRVHLVLAGWPPNPSVDASFHEGARQFAPEAKTSFVDGRDDKVRRQVWHAADLFVSPSDNIQETFGLAVIEAMACGLPVVATDWDGYRDLVADGETGLLVPAMMMEGATVGATSRYLIGELAYDHFVSECSQATVVDVPSIVAAVSRLVEDESLRRKMGAAGRRRAQELFAWPKVIAAYERLWAALDLERRRHAGRMGHDRPPWTGPDGPAVYPAPERSFAGYPSRMIDGPDRLIAGHRPAEAVEIVRSLALTNHARVRRPADARLLRAAIERVPCTVADLDRFLAESGVEPSVGRATVAWMLKYDLLRIEGAGRTAGGHEL
jgi:glycosyltransferase involved in cell wall biosynthesis